MADRYVNYDKLLEARHRLGLDEMSKIHKVNAFNQFIDNLPTADVVEVPKWIRIAKELPPKNELVLAYVHQLGHRPYMMTTRLIEFGTDKFFIDNYGRTVSNVSHWMPLPEPPSGAKMDGNK